MGNACTSPLDNYSAAKANPKIENQKAEKIQEMKTLKGFAKVANRSMEPR